MIAKLTFLLNLAFAVFAVTMAWKPAEAKNIFLGLAEGTPQSNLDPAFVLLVVGYFGFFYGVMALHSLWALFGFYGTRSFALTQFIFHGLVLGLFFHVAQVLQGIDYVNLAVKGAVSFNVEKAKELVLSSVPVQAHLALAVLFLLSFLIGGGSSKKKAAPAKKQKKN